MLPSYYFYWFRIDNKHMTEPWLDQGPIDLAYRSDIAVFHVSMDRIFKIKTWVWRSSSSSRFFVSHSNRCSSYHSWKKSNMKRRPWKHCGSVGAIFFNKIIYFLTNVFFSSNIRWKIAKCIAIPRLWCL